VRRRFALLVAATTSAVVLAFVIPLALLVRTLAEDRAIRVATVQAQCIAGAATNVTDPVRREASFQDCSRERSAGPQPTVVFPDGTVLGPMPPPNDPALVAARTDGTAQTVRTRTAAIVYVVNISGRGTLVVRAVVPDAELHVGVVTAWVILGVLAFLLLLSAVFAAGRLAARLSRPLHQVAAAAQAMRAGRLDTRVAEKGPPEVVALAGALNGLAERVQQLLAAERDAVADLSHRLRTPVTALRLDTDGVADPDVAERLRTHVTALERTVDAIVHDARRPSRTQPGASCDVGVVVAERVQFWSALADDQGRPLQLFLPDRPLRARLDGSDLADIVDVLVDNVFAHTDEGVAITVWVVARGDGGVVLSVEDAGPGMPAGDVVTRGRSGAGSSGLGLDIVRRLAIASGGSLELGTSPSGGALVRVVLGRA
jgi:signal transduction histidine kinase